MSDSYHIILAAGGTGGHIFPAESLAEELTARSHRVTMITDQRFADYSAASMKGIFAHVPIHYISAASLGRNVWKRALNALMILRGIWQARQLMKAIRPQAVVGFGGYPSFPTMMAATSLGIPTIIHEQNALLGKANRVLADRVTTIAASFEQTGLVKAECRHKLVVVGNPVRAAVRALHDIPAPELAQDGILRLLVMGGSQGALVFSNVVPNAVALLPEPLRKRLRIDQQTRAEALEATRRAYEAIGVQADLAPFFADVPARLAAAHLVIGRSGASTMAELTCAGRPAILVPYPSAADDHQTANALALDDAGGAWLMPEDAFTAEALAAKLEAFLRLPSSLAKAAVASRAYGRPEAAAKLADLVLSHAEKHARLRGGSLASVSAQPSATERAA
jgi:UDP-N-acetylglucosamine--N-acetylmuramyl-(pentapeptide) pyrophosphoryl-undecaprenol N-acetylglucosamine transferase